MINKRKQIFGWLMYDWANSAYVTTVVVAILPAYFAAVVVPEGGVNFAGSNYSATTLWGLTISFSAFLVLIIAPIVGAIADFSAAKKRFLIFCCYGGCLATCLLFFINEREVLLTLGLFLVAQVGFVAGNIFYDAFLPEIATDEEIDWVSGQGFAYGYVGGGIQFALSLGLVSLHSQIGISASLAARLAILMAGLWWGGFALLTCFLLKETRSSQSLPTEYQSFPAWRAYTTVGMLRTWATLKKVKLFRHLLLFLVAYLIYNNGIQTVITMATIYGTEELGFTTNVLMLTLLVIQFVSIVGALAFSQLATLITAKNALIITLLGWSFVVIYAYFLTTPREYFILGGVVGLVQGGSQSLSRSFYGVLIPRQAAAEFYGFYSVFNKGSAIIGPLVFALIRQVAGNSRIAILSLIFFFILGLILLWLVDESKAKQAKDSNLFRA